MTTALPLTRFADETDPAEIRRRTRIQAAALREHYTKRAGLTPCAGCGGNSEESGTLRCVCADKAVSVDLAARCEANAAAARAERGW